MIKKEFLEQRYLKEKKSMQEIAQELKCSHTQVSYWMEKHNILRRSISEGVYIKNNPNGDPFIFKKPATVEDGILYGMGLGLYWGEGTKMNKHSVRLGNTDPELVKTFIKFLEKFFTIRCEDLRFSIQIFSDMNPEQVLKFWVKELGVAPEQFSKTTISISGSMGNYRKKSKHGVLMLYYHNKKMRDALVGLLPESPNQSWSYLELKKGQE